MARPNTSVSGAASNPPCSAFLPSTSAAMAEAVHRQKQQEAAATHQLQAGSERTTPPGVPPSGNLIFNPGSFKMPSATTELLSSRSDGSWYSGGTASYSAADPVVQKLLDQPLLLNELAAVGELEQLSRQTTAHTSHANGGGHLGPGQEILRDRPTTSGIPPPLPQLPTSSNGLPVTGNKKSQYHRTKLCPWHREGKCFMGEACNYAHSREELRPKPDLSKTKLCPELVKGKQCTRQGCRFAHDFVELRATSAFFKTRICKYWQRGYCPAGYECRHAHGREDLRASPGVPSISDEKQCIWNWLHAPAPPFGPPASSLPSPSFLSTSTSTPNSNKTPTESLAVPSTVTLEQCVALLAQQHPDPPPSPPANTSQQEAVEQLKLWISQEVERQVAHRTSKSATTSEPRTPRPDLPETAMLLPQDVLQNLNNSATPVSGLNAHFSWASVAGESPLSFAAAVRSLQACGPGFSAAPSSHQQRGGATVELDNAAARLLGDATPTQVLLRALGGMAANADESQGDEDDLESDSPLQPRAMQSFAA